MVSAWVLWSIFDRRTGERVTVVAFRTKAQAEAQIEHWRARDRKGKRPDVSHLMPHLEARGVG